MSDENDVAHINSVGMIAGTLVHDIGGYLTAALPAMRSLKKQSENTELQNDLISDIDHALNMINDVNKAAKALALGEELKINDVSMAELALKLSGCDKDYPSPRVDALDRAHVLRANIYGLLLCLNNLTRNSYNARKDATVTLSSFLVDGMVKIVHDDNGPGMTEDQVLNVFGNYTTNETEGHIHGLGLQLVQAHIRNMSGRIQCESVLNEGTKFIITLPSAK